MKVTILPITPVTEHNLPALIDLPIIQLCNISSISRIKCMTVETGYVHYRFFIRMSNRDVYTSAIKPVAPHLGDLARTQLEQQRADLANMLMQTSIKAVALTTADLKMESAT